MQTILGTDDSVNTCDCCGKTNLKFTFAVDVDGEVLHYGSTCVTKWTGVKAAAAISEIARKEAERKAGLEKKFNATFEAIQYAAKRAEAMRLGLVGVGFKVYCEVEREAADAKRAEIFA